MANSKKIGRKLLSPAVLFQFIGNNDNDDDNDIGNDNDNDNSNGLVMAIES